MHDWLKEIVSYNFPNLIKLNLVYNQCCSIDQLKDLASIIQDKDYLSQLQMLALPMPFYEYMKIEPADE